MDERSAAIWGLAEPHTVREAQHRHLHPRLRCPIAGDSELFGVFRGELHVCGGRGTGWKGPNTCPAAQRQPRSKEKPFTTGEIGTEGSRWETTA